MSSADCGDVGSGSQAVRVRYREPQVPYGQACVSEEQHATCEDGALGAWTGSFVEEACAASQPSDCGAVAHGGFAERTRFEAPTVGYGQKCVSETQTAPCHDGSLGAWSGSFAFEGCVVEPPSDCGATAHGSYAKRTRYLASTVPYGGNCVAQEQEALCANGVLGPYSGNFEFDACVVGPAANCDGVLHGQSAQRTMYEVTQVPFGQVCPMEVQTRTCDNGAWSPWTGQYLYESCDVEPPAGCEGSPHGTIQSRTLYAESTAVFGSSCKSEVQTRVCNDGAWSGWTGSYSYLYCSVQQCAVGSVQTQSCGLNNRGKQTMPCTSYGYWRGYWDPCVDPDTCVDGSYIAPSPCNGNQGWQKRSCVSGQPKVVGECGACSGNFVDPCGQNKTVQACFAAQYDGVSCGVWVENPTPHCAIAPVVTTQCYDIQGPAACTPNFGCSWTWLP
jgi:hypothetical protein